MNWFLSALICVFGWGCADLFYKSGTDENDRFSHLKIAVWVGFVMGITAFLLMPLSESGLTPATIPRKALIYAPASLGYIVSMVIGYAGLRYLELSIVSPVQNASGALTVAVICIFYLVTGRAEKIGEAFGPLDIIGTLIIIAGTVALAFAEQRSAQKETEGGAAAVSKAAEDLPAEERRQKKYRTGALALLFPVLYCVFDTLGTAADGIILDSGSGSGLGEFDVLILYGLTFLLAGIVCYAVLWIKEKRPYRMFAKKELPKAAAAVCEQFGQIFYVFAMAANPLMAAPVVASYCILSVILSRLFLKEKPEKGQAVCVTAVIVGIVLLGISEGLGA